MAILIGRESCLAFTTRTICRRGRCRPVSMYIDTGALPGVSDVVLDVRRDKPWTVVALVDNAGTRATDGPRSRIGTSR